MSSKNSKQKFQKVSNDDLRRLFSAAFSIDPTLEPTEFYNYLKENGFNEQKAILSVLDRVKQPGEYFLPAHLLKTHSTNGILSESPQSPDSERVTSSPNPFVTPVNKRHRAPVENSDDDEAGKTSIALRHNKSVVVPKFNPPPLLDESDSATIDGESSDDEDTRPPKRRAHGFKPAKRKVRSPMPPGKNSFLQTPSLTPQTTSTASFATNSTSKGGQRKAANREGFDLDLPESSDIDIDEGGGDYYNESWSDSNSELEDDIKNWSKHPLGSSPKESPKKRSSPSRGNVNNLVLKHKNNTKATAWCHFLAKTYYPNNLDLIGCDINPYGQYDPRALPEHLAKIRKAALDQVARDIKITFPSSSNWQDVKTGKKGYPFMRIDGVDFYPGDWVVVRSSEPCSIKQKGTPVSEPDAYNPGFAKIVYLYKDDFGDPMVHLQWFEHGSATPFKEFAGTNELFLVSQCDDNSLKCIISKIQGAREDGVGVVEGNYQDNNYFYRLHYDPCAERFTNAAAHELESDQTPLANFCGCCNRQKEAAEYGNIKIENDRNRRVTSVCHKGITYGLLDFVYIYEEPTKPYIIGQVKRFYHTQHKKGPQLKVDVYERVDELHIPLSDQVSNKTFRVADDRKLYKSGKTIEVDFGQVEEKCYVRHKDHIEDRDRFKAEKGRFWVKDKVPASVDPNGYIRLNGLVPLPAEEIEYSERSKIELQLEEYEKSEFFKHNKALRTMDIFAGIGGLTIGLNQNGVLKTFWAVEFAPAAAHTFQRNNSDVQMFIADGNTLLDRRIRLCKGEELDPYLDEDGNIIPDLPLPGEVDVINGGPPCPGFSGANRHKTWDDIRNTLILMFLSYLEFYKPKYFLLENVQRLLSHRLGAIQVAKGKTEGGIEQGTLKLILRTMTGLGYQAEYTLLQAAEHGLPQSRPRVFFWASRPDYPLPEFPQPENIVKRGGTRGWHRTRRSAPHKMVTVGDVMTDLPQFEWDNPHGIIPETTADKADRLERWNRGIAQYPVSRDEQWIGMDRLPYASNRPLNETQRKLRALMPKESAVITNHVTMHFGDLMTECVVNVPIGAGKDHQDMPLALRRMQKTTCPSNKNAAKNGNYVGRIGRLDIDGAFAACMTTIYPLNMNGKVLHPYLHRIVTVREYLRAQGFPDSFDFDLEEEENIPKFVIRGIRNSVPVPLAAALGDGLLQSLLEKFRTEMIEAKVSRATTPPVKKEEFSVPHRQSRVFAFEEKGATFDEPIELDFDE